MAKWKRTVPYSQRGVNSRNDQLNFLAALAGAQTSIGVKAVGREDLQTNCRLCSLLLKATALHSPSKHDTNSRARTWRELGAAVAAAMPSHTDAVAAFRSVLCTPNQFERCHLPQARPCNPPKHRSHSKGTHVVMFLQIWQKPLPR